MDIDFIIGIKLYICGMESFKEQLKINRLQKKETLNTLSDKSGIDISVLSKFEKGIRVPNRIQLESIEKALKIRDRQLRTIWLAEKIVSEISHEDDALGVLRVAESFFNYGKSINHELEELIEEVDKLKKRLDKKRPIPKAQLTNLMNAFKIEYTYDSNKIEGNTLTLQETALVIDKGFTIGGKSLNEHLEALNHAEAFDFILDLVKGKDTLTEYNLLQVHNIILKSIDRENAGRYRGVNVRIGGSRHTPPEPYLIRPQMDDYFNYYKMMQKEIHPLLLAADMHEKLVTIHPFIDGNGRTSRLIMNLVAYKHGFSLINISGDKESRMAYYKALDDTRHGNQPDAFRMFVLKEAVKSLKDWLKWVG